MNGSNRTEKTEKETAPVGAETVSEIPDPFQKLGIHYEDYTDYLARR